jgi:PAS domain S-box-containing protein
LPEVGAELLAQVAQLQQDNHKLARINAALIERIESGMAQGNNPYTTFQHSVVLAEQVRERTDALNQAMAELKASNHLLINARLRAETLRGEQVAAQKAQESERWIRLITDNVPALIGYLNADLVYEFTNKVYEEWYCWPRGMMLGQSLREVHSEQHCQRLDAYVARALAGESVTFEFAETNINNQERYMLRSYVPNTLASGEVVGIFVLIRDITERRRTAEALHQAYQHLEQRVAQRTSELTALNDQLLQEIDERRRVEARLREAKLEAEQDKQVVLQAITYGAVGFITKSSPRLQMTEAIQQILNGNVYLPPDIIRTQKPGTHRRLNENPGFAPELLQALTRKQLLVLERMTKGESNKQIAYTLEIAETTVKAHVSAILRKLNVHNRVQAILSAGDIDFGSYLRR